MYCALFYLKKICYNKKKKKGAYFKKMAKRNRKYDDEAISAKGFDETKKELAELVRNVMNDLEFRPTLVSDSKSTSRKSFTKYLIEAFEKKHGKNQDHEGLYFVDLERKIPCLLLAKVFEDFEISKEVFQGRFRVEITNSEDCIEFFAIQISDPKEFSKPKGE